jgi:hypothetical protein
MIITTTKGKYTIDADFVDFLYEKGYSTKQASDIIGCPPGTLRRINRERNIYGGRPQSDILTPNQIKILISLYQSGMTAGEVGESFSISDDTVCNLLNKNGITRRVGNDPVYKHKDFNHAAFSDFKEEPAAYYYGFMLSDGCLSKNKSGIYNSLGLVVKTSDEYILKRLLDYLRSDNKIRRRVEKDKRTGNTYYSSSISFNNTEITKRFTDQGFTPRKSMRETPPVSKDLLNNKDFWRGVVDGDGWVCSTNSDRWCVLGLCGSEAICKAFLHFIEGCIEVKTPRKVRTCGKGLYNVVFSGNDARQAAKLLYENSDYHLTRKYDSASKNFW